MRTITSVLMRISVVFCLLFLVIPHNANSQSFNSGNNNSGFFLRKKHQTDSYQITSQKSIFALGLGAKLIQPPSESNTSVSLSYGLTAEFQYVRNDVLSWYINLDYYNATYHSDIFNSDSKRNWVVALIGARIFPEKKSFGLNFNIAGGPVFTDADNWKTMFDLGAGYEVRLGSRYLINPYLCLHLFNESGPGGFRVIPVPKSSFSLGATLSVVF